MYNEVTKCNLYIKGIRFNRDMVDSFDEYPFDIPIISRLSEIRFEKPITFSCRRKWLGKIYRYRSDCGGSRSKCGGRHKKYGV